MTSTGDLEPDARTLATSTPLERPPAPRSSRRTQAAIDCATALVLAMLAWPFPIARAVLPPLVHVAAILAFWQVVQVVYFAAAMAAWGATAGTRLAGLEVVAANGGDPSRTQRVRWGLVSGATALGVIVAPRPSGGRLSAEQIAGVRVVVAGSAVY